MDQRLTKKVLVTGASGNLGSAVVKALSERGIEARGGCRHPENIPVLKGVEAVKLDYDAPETVESSLQGVDSVFLVAPPLDAGAAARLTPVIDLAKAAEVGHVVLNSALGVDQSEEAPLRIVEHYLMDSGVNYTILRPNFFMENFSSGFISPMIAQGGIFIAAGDGKTSFISASDVAEVAAISLIEGHYAKQYNLTGSEALDHKEVARIISEVSGREVRYHDITEEEMLKGARDGGLSEDQAQFMAILYHVVREGWAAPVTYEFMKITGREPVSFADFARKRADSWK